MINARAKCIGLILSTIFLIQGICFAAAPREIGGLVLGENVDSFQDKLDMETARPIRYHGYLREVEIKDLPGFKSGTIWYNAISSPNRIVRIKLKYEDSSKDFFDALLKQFEKRFGKPREWRGDSFNIFISWKWSLVDSQNNRVSMIIQHNIKDPGKKMGNNIKLTRWDLIDAECRIFEQKYPERKQEKPLKKDKFKKMGPKDWDRFIPH